MDTPSLNAMMANLKRKDFAIVTSDKLPTEATQVIAAAAIEKMELVGRMRPHCFIDTSPEESDKTYTPFSFDESGDAWDWGEAEDWKYEGEGLSDQDIDLVSPAKGFKLPWGSRTIKSVQLMAGKSRDSITKVRKREDNKISAILSSASSSVTGTAVLSGASGDPVKDLENAKTAVRDLGYEANTVFVEGVNFSELASMAGSNDWKRITEELIAKGVIPVFQGLKVVPLLSTQLAHGTCYVGYTSQDPGSAIHVGESYSIRENILDDGDNHTTKVQHWEKIAPVLARPDAMAKITGW